MAQNPRHHPRNRLSRADRQRNWNEAQERNVRTRKIGRKGEANRSVLVELRNGTHYHATKGWRFAARVAEG